MLPMRQWFAIIYHREILSTASHFWGLNIWITTPRDCLAISASHIVEMLVPNTSLAAVPAAILYLRTTFLANPK